MPHFLIQVAYTPEAFNALVKNPQDRIETVRPAIERLGGSITTGWYAFGEYDVILITEMPNNVASAAIALAFAAGGACKTVRTTPLLSAAEFQEALRKAGTAGYRPVTTATAASA